MSSCRVVMVIVVALWLVAGCWWLSWLHCGRLQVADGNHGCTLVSCRLLMEIMVALWKSWLHCGWLQVADDNHGCTLETMVALLSAAGCWWKSWLHCGRLQVADGNHGCTVVGCKLLMVIMLHCGRLQAVVDNSAQRLLSLSAQWEKHRAPLIEQFRMLRQLSSQREVSCFGGLCYCWCHHIRSSTACTVLFDSTKWFPVLIMAANVTVHWGGWELGQF